MPDREGFRRARTPGGQVFQFAESGEGPLVVLFHGFPDTPATWDAARTRLNAAGYRTVAPFLRGYHPDTIVPGRGYGLGEIAEDALRFLDALGEDQAVFVGHDWGATVALGAAGRGPQRLRGVVSVGLPHPGTVKPSLAVAWAARHFLALRMPWSAAMVRRGDFAYLDMLYRRWSPGWHGPARERCLAAVKEAFRDPVVLDAALAYYRALRPASRSAAPRRLPVRGMVVGGTADPVPAEEFARSERGFAADCRVVMLDGAGHWPHQEREDVFVDHLAGFLASL